MNLKRIWILLLVFFMLPVGLAVNIELSDQGTGAKQAGSLVNNGDLTVEIWNAATAGTLIWSETFVDAIKDGSWNVMLGQNASNPLSLEYGQKYWKDYKINSEDIDFLDNSGNTIERLEFYSPLGYINSKTLFNFSMINPCAEGYAIRSINTDGSVVCEQISAGAVASGWTDSGAVVELVTSTDSINANTLYVDNTNGRVGIGTTAPSHKLTVMGSGYFLGDTSVPNAPTDLGFYLGKSLSDENRRMEVVSPAGGVGYIDFTEPGIDYRGRLAYYMSDNSFRFYTNGAERMRITGNGNVGIGTTSPSYKLHVNGNFYADTVNTGIGNTEVYLMNQNVRTTDAVTFATIDTGSGAKELGDASITDGDTNSIPTNDQVYDFVASYVGSGGTGDVYVNEAGDTMTGNLDMNGNKIINVNKLHATSIGIADTTTSAEANIPAGNSLYVQNDVKVGGNIQGSTGDIAEIVHISGDLEPGDVVVIKGTLTVEKSTKPYDTAVAGIISTDPSYVLAVDREGLPLALSGIVPVKVTNESGYIKPKDLLTTSSKEGYAMKCPDPEMCKGAILGKAMGYLNESEGMINALVMLG